MNFSIMWQKMLPVNLNEQIFKNYRYSVRSPLHFFFFFLERCAVVPAIADFFHHPELVNKGPFGSCLQCISVKLLPFQKKYFY